MNVWKISRIDREWIKSYWTDQAEAWKRQFSGIVLHWAVTTFSANSLHVKQILAFTIFMQKFAEYQTMWNSACFKQFKDVIFASHILIFGIMKYLKWGKVLYLKFKICILVPGSKFLIASWHHFHHALIHVILIILRVSRFSLGLGRYS